jgi:hypothetical protein
VKALLRFALKCTGLHAGYALYEGGPLKEYWGWHRSINDRQVCGPNGEPLPWFTYPAIDFLAPRIPVGTNVWEWGTGSSTLWWATRTGSVSGVEHSREWYDKMQRLIPDNASIRFLPKDDPSYPLAAIESGRKFQIVSIDGRNRVLCARTCPDVLSDDGVVVWDNTDREKYQPGIDFLKAAGFHQVDFWGLGPTVNVRWCTSVFFRWRNCLGV